MAIDEDNIEARAGPRGTERRGAKLVLALSLFALAGGLLFGTAKAYPISAFGQEKGPVEIRDEVGGKPLAIRYDPADKGLRVAEAPEDVRWMYSFWFAWYAFHPETAVYEPRWAEDRHPPARTGPK